MAYDREQFVKVQEYHALGYTNHHIANLTGVSYWTIRRWRKRIEEEGEGKASPNKAIPKVKAAPAVTADDVKDMRIAALEQQLREAAGDKKAAPQVQVVSAYQPDDEIISIDRRWNRAEVENAERIKRALTQHIFSATLPNEPIGITFSSDQHISPGNIVDMERMRLDAELIARTEGLYAILGGDGVDNHIKHRSAVMHQRSTPHEQWDMFEFYLSIFQQSIIALISGNHDLWTDQLAGVDVVKMLSQRQGLCYAPDEAIISLRVGSQTYKIGVRHQYRMNSTFNETHAVKQWYRNGSYDWDIGCVCHHHVSAIEPFWGHDLERWACRPGSYQIHSAYSRQFGYNSTRPMCPTFVLSPERRHIVGFHDVRDAVVYLEAVRTKFRQQQLCKAA